MLLEEAVLAKGMLECQYPLCLCKRRQQQAAATARAAPARATAHAAELAQAAGQRAGQREGGLGWAADPAAHPDAQGWGPLRQAATSLAGLQGAFASVRQARRRVLALLFRRYLFALRGRVCLSCALV